MVRFTSVLRRVPVIRFRKGGLGTSGPAPSASPAGAATSAAPPAASSVKNDPKIPKEETAKVLRAVVKVPKKMLIEAAKERETITLNVSLEKSGKRPSSHK